MQEFIDKLIDRLEEESFLCNCWGETGECVVPIEKVDEIVKELAEQHKMECVKIVSEVDKEKLDSLHKKILKNNKMLEIVTEEEINALIQAKEYNNGWISVKDRLPEPYVKVLVLEENGDIHLCRYHDNCKRFYYDGSDWDIKLGDVTHWQLPPAYKEGGV